MAVGEFLKPNHKNTAREGVD